MKTILVILALTLVGCGPKGSGWNMADFNDYHYNPQALTHSASDAIDTMTRPLPQYRQPLNCNSYSDASGYTQTTCY